VSGSLYVRAGEHCLLCDLCLINSEFCELILLPKILVKHFSDRYFTRN